MSDMPKIRPSAAEVDADRELKLIEIRREAEQRGAVAGKGVRPAGAPFPMASPETGYYGIPLLKEPAWTWEIPLYFFVGGAAGAAAVMGAIADYTGADRVFKPQSPMSVGVWTLLGFSGGAAAAAFAGFMRERYGPSLPLRVIENAGQAASLLFGLPFSNYTGVLIGATAIPVWNQNAGELPIHFAASGVSTAVGMLELLGHRKSRALQLLGLGAAIFESWEGWRIESRQQPGLNPLKRGTSGWITRAGGVLSGPVPAILRLASLVGGRKNQDDFRRWAAISSIAGSLITRIAWVHAGHVSARDWRQPLGIG
jgi:hypothetical protein